MFLNKSVWKLKISFYEKITKINYQILFEWLKLKNIYDFLKDKDTSLLVTIFIDKN